jgi:hypothetical protein
VSPPPSPTPLFYLYLCTNPNHNSLKRSQCVTLQCLITSANGCMCVLSTVSPLFMSYSQYICTSIHICSLDFRQGGGPILSYRGGQGKSEKYDFFFLQVWPIQIVVFWGQKLCFCGGFFVTLFRKNFLKTPTFLHNDRESYQEGGAGQIAPYAEICRCTRLHHATFLAADPR